jgi:hypothetical protein
VAQPQINKTKWSPQQGGLNSDIDPKNIGNGDLLVNGVNTGGMNIRSVGRGANVSPDYEPMYGNEYVYKPDALTVQNKKFRIYVDTSDQPVLVGQPDIVLNGDFSAGSTDWTLGTNWSIVGLAAAHAPGVASSLSQTQTGIVPGMYGVTFTISGVTAGSITIPSDQFSGTAYSTNGTFYAPYAVYVDTLGNFNLVFDASSSFDGSIDNIIVTKTADIFVFTPSLTTPSGISLITQTVSYWPISSNVTDTLTAIEDWFANETSNGFPARLPVTSQVATGAYTGYVEVEFTDFPNFDYFFSIEYDEILSSFKFGDKIQVIISQEAIDPGCLGEWNLIGSDDKPTDSFQFWTTRRTLPSELEIWNISNSLGVVRITTLNPHGLVNNQAVRISNVVGVPEAIGIWTVTVIDAYNFDLNNSAFIGPTYVSGGLVGINIYGVGEIGVAVQDDQGVISYTRLLRSKEFNFSTLKQIDCRAKRKQDTQKFSVYYTDNFNLPRVFYYKGAYITDGGLTIVDSNNIYQYGNIDLESKWIINNEKFRIEVISQTTGGGAVKSGLWRYSARLLTSDFSATNWSQLTEGIPVFANDNNYVGLIGSLPDVVCNKVNQLKLTNEVSGIFTYVEIAALNYFNTAAPSGFIIGRYVLDGNLEQFFSHNGYENNVLDLDVGSLNDFSQSFYLAQNVELLDGRAILSNLTPNQTYDFREWVSTFEYSLNYRELISVGSWGLNQLSVGEYQVPMNVYSYKSHMMMETYRYGFMFKLKSGALTPVFYPGYDIKIDLPATLPLERRPGTFVNFDLTRGGSGPTPARALSIYITWENIDLAFLIDGTPAYELIDEIIPCRATVVPEVLAHGMLALGVSGQAGNIDNQPALTNSDFIRPDEATISTTIPDGIIPYPFAFGGGGDGWNPRKIDLTNDIYPGTVNDVSFGSQRTAYYFYSPEIYFNLTEFGFQTGDELYVFGSPLRYGGYSFREGGGGTNGEYLSYYFDWDGETGVSQNPTPIPVGAAENVLSPAAGVKETRSIAGTNHRNFTVYAISRFTGPISDDLYPLLFQNEKAVLGITNFATTINDNNTLGNADYGFYRAIYYRPIPNKYGDPASTQYTEFLPPFVVGSQIATITFDTYGDCFTQKSYMKQRYPAKWDYAAGTPTPSWNAAGTWGGWGAALGFYGQNRSNIQLRCLIDNNFNDDLLPPKDINAYIFYGYTDNGNPTAFNISRRLYVIPDGNGRDAQSFYNNGYTPTNNVISKNTFNPLLEYQTDWGNAIAWSNPESEGSNTDNLRVFPPLNLKFLDYTQGSITEAKALNGELVTIQPREVQRQYFNSTAMISTQNGGDVYLGSGAVLSRRGTTMNKFGSKHKWSVIVGLSDKGSDVMYGIDDINKTVWRIGYDGTNALEEIQGMKSFFANNLEWIRGKYTPAHDEGIRGVANQRYREVIWTLRGRKDYPEWQSEDNFCYLKKFYSSYGNELVPCYNITSSASTEQCWESRAGTFPYAINTAWTFTVLPGPTQPYAFIKTNLADEGYLLNTSSIPLVPGNTYVINIRANSSTTGIGVAFQLGGTIQYSITSAGDYYFNYTAQPGDNNICLYCPVGAKAYVTYASIRESYQNDLEWNTSGGWVLSNNEACTNSGGTAAQLFESVPDYITPNMPYTLKFFVDGYVSGDLRVKIGNAISPTLNITADGEYTVSLSPTATGVITFIPNPTFDGCIKSNISLCTSGVLKEYNTGDIVQTTGYGSVMSTWSQTPDIWICLKDNVTSNPYSPPDPDDPDWELIPHTNPAYYTEYTVVYNEIKNRFQSFMTILPRIYAHFQNGYLVPRPISDTGEVYVSDSGIPTTWFNDGVSAHSGDAYFDATINSPEGRKRYLAVRVESDVAPTSMTVTSGSGSSTTLAAEFEQREGQEFDGYVKDTTTESIIMGDFGIFRFTIGAGTYNKINSFIASVRDRARKWFR